MESDTAYAFYEEDLAYSINAFYDAGQIAVAEGRDNDAELIETLGQNEAANITRHYNVQTARTSREDDTIPSVIVVTPKNILKFALETDHKHTKKLNITAASNLWSRLIYSRNLGLKRTANGSKSLYLTWLKDNSSKLSFVDVAETMQRYEILKSVDPACKTGDVLGKGWGEKTVEMCQAYIGWMVLQLVDDLEKAKNTSGEK